MNLTMPPPPPPPPHRNPNFSFSSMAPPPSPPPLVHPEAEAALRPDASMVEADGTTKPGPSSCMPPPPPAGSSPPSEPDASTGGTAVTSPTVSGPSADEAENASGTEMADAVPPEQRQQQPRPRPRAPYAIPDWSAAPKHPFFVEVIEAGISHEKLDVSKKGAYMFGRFDLCDFVLDHSSISVMQFRNDGEVFLYDLGSTHGSSINKTQIKKKMYTKLRVGDLIQFGQSSRLYFFQARSELMPPADEAGNTGDNKEMADVAPPEQQRQQKSPPRAPYAIPDWT